MPQYHGIVERALLSFSTRWDNWLSPIVGLYDTSNPWQPRISCWLPLTEYSFWHDVLRAERPLTFFYDLTVIGGANYVRNIMLGSSTEAIGEGPADLSP